MPEAQTHEVEVDGKRYNFTLKPTGETGVFSLQSPSVFSPGLTVRGSTEAEAVEKGMEEIRRIFGGRSVTPEC